jgi:hypothetical protein
MGIVALAVAVLVRAIGRGSMARTIGVAAVDPIEAAV